MYTCSQLDELHVILSRTTFYIRGILGETGICQHSLRTFAAYKGVPPEDDSGNGQNGNRESHLLSRHSTQRGSVAYVTHSPCVDRVQPLERVHHTAQRALVCAITRAPVASRLKKQRPWPTATWTSRTATQSMQKVRQALRRRAGRSKVRRQSMARQAACGTASERLVRRCQSILTLQVLICRQGSGTFHLTVVCAHAYELNLNFCRAQCQVECPQHYDPPAKR